MERFAKVVDGFAINVTKLDPKAVLEDFADWLPCGNAAPGWTYDGTDFAEPVAPFVAAAEADVLAERDRRIDAGITVTVSGIGAIPVSGRPQVQVDLTSLTTAAQIAISIGDTTATFPFRDEARVIHNLTGTQVMALYMSGVEWLAAVRAAAWALIDADPIPSNYDDDVHWPRS